MDLVSCSASLPHRDTGRWRVQVVAERVAAGVAWRGVGLPHARREPRAPRTCSTPPDEIESGDYRGLSSFGGPHSNSVPRFAGVCFWCFGMPVGCETTAARPLGRLGRLQSPRFLGTAWPAGFGPGSRVGPSGTVRRRIEALLFIVMPRTVSTAALAFGL